MGDHPWSGLANSPGCNSIFALKTQRPLQTPCPLGLKLMGGWPPQSFESTKSPLRWVAIKITSPNLLAEQIDLEACRSALLTEAVQMSSVYPFHDPRAGQASSRSFLRPCSPRLVALQDLEHDLGQALNEVQASRKTWFNRTLSSIKTVTGVQGKETC